MSAPTHEQGTLLMEYFKLWDTPLDGEAWTFFRKCSAEGVFASYERFSETVDRTSHEFVLFDRVLCAYEQAATLMKHGLMHPSLYFETWADATRVWERVEPVVRGMREHGSSDAYTGLEWLAVRRQEWAAEGAD
jgi:hypothetical protein